MKTKGNVIIGSLTETSSFLTDTGSTNAYAVALRPAITAYTTGLKIIFQAANTNTSASTLAINGLTAQTIKKNETSDLSSGDIIANHIIIVIYDGTNFQIVAGAFPASMLTGAMNKSQMVQQANDANVTWPIILFAKNVTVLTSSTPADIATISVPFARYRVSGASTSSSALNFMVPETFTATMASATIELRNGSNGTGNVIISGAAGPSASTNLTQCGVANTTTIYTAATLYIRQTTDSANSGAISYYITIWPLP